MDAPQCIFARNKVQAAQLGRQQCLRNSSLWDFRYKRFGKLFHGTRGDATVFHLFGSDVIGLHAHFGELHVSGFLNVGMGYLVTVFEQRGLAKHNIFLACLVVLVNIFRAVEPHQISYTKTVAEMGDDAFLARPHGKLLKTQNLSLDLHVWHVARQLVDTIHLAAVNILIGIVFKHIAPGLDIELLVQNVLSLGAYPCQIHDVLRENVHVFSLQRAPLQLSGRKVWSV